MPSYRSLLPLYAVICLGFLGYALTITLFIPMLMDKHTLLLPITSSTALRVSLSGLLLAMYPLGQFFGSPVIGNLSDFYGRKKILLLSLTMCILGYLGIAMSIEFHQLILLFICSFLTGLCESNMAISQSVIVTTFQDPTEKTRFIGYAYSACSLGYVLGPLLGGVAGNVLGYSGPFVITAIVVLCLVLWIYYGFKDDYIPDKAVPISLLVVMGAMKSIFNRPKLYRLYMINFLIFFAIQGLYRVVPLYVVNQWNPPLPLYAMLISYVSLLCFVVNLVLLGKLAKHFTTQRLLSGLLFVGGLFVMAIVIPGQFNAIWFTFGLAVIPTVMALPTCTTWLSEHVAANEQGQALGNNQALLVLGEASSAAIGGLIAAILVPLPIVVMGSILLITGFLVLRVRL